MMQVSFGLHSLHLLVLLAGVGDLYLAAMDAIYPINPGAPLGCSDELQLWSFDWLSLL